MGLRLKECCLLFGVVGAIVFAFPLHIAAATPGSFCLRHADQRSCFDLAGLRGAGQEGTQTWRFCLGCRRIHGRRRVVIEVDAHVER